MLPSPAGKIIYKSRGGCSPLQTATGTVIIAHGYRNSRLQDDVPALSLAEELVNAGYHVLMFVFRNCGESDGNFTSIGQYEVRDLLGAIEFVSSHPDISPQNSAAWFFHGGRYGHPDRQP